MERVTFVTSRAHRFKMCRRQSVFDGVSKQHFSTAKPIRPRYRLYPINEEFLDDGICSHDHAWLWGWLATDGSIESSQRNGLKGIKWTLRYDSYNILYFLKNILNSNHPICFASNGSPLAKDPATKYHKATVNFLSKKLASKAAQVMDCTLNRKAFEVKYPERAFMDESLDVSFVRGVFEGDGTLSISLSKGLFTLNFYSSNYKFLTRIHNVVSVNCFGGADKGSVLSTKSSSEKPIYTLSYCAQSDIVSILDWMYSPVDIEKKAVSSERCLLAPCHIKKYNRYMLLKEIQTLSKSERIDAMKQIMCDEKNESTKVLHQLFEISLDQKPNTQNFRFYKTFKRCALDVVSI